MNNIEHIKLEKKIKSTGWVYVALFFGVQYLYLGKPGTFLLYLFTGAGLGMWFLKDLLFLWKTVEDHNETIYDKMKVNEILNNQNK